MWKVRGQVLLTPTLTQLVWEGKREKERERERKREKEREFKERGSTFCLDYRAIGPSNHDKIRGKVDPHCKRYAWVPVLWSFDKI